MSIAHFVIKLLHILWCLYMPQNEDEFTLINTYIVDYSYGKVQHINMSYTIMICTIQKGLVASSKIFIVILNESSTVLK